MLRNELALRMRREPGGGWRLGLKGCGAMVDGISRRQEWEMRVASPVNRLSDLPPGPIRDRVSPLAIADAPLLELLTTDFQRRILYLTDEPDPEGTGMAPAAAKSSAWAELALDRGRVLAAGRSVTLHEVEVERLRGPFDRVQRFAADLAHRFDLAPSVHSKFSLGLALAAGDGRGGNGD